MQLHIRDFTESDAEAVVAIRNSIQPEPITAEQYLTWYRADKDRTDATIRRFVAEDETGTVVGTCMVEASPELPEGLVAVGVNVHPTYRRQGVGQTLWTHVEGLARQLQAKGLRAWNRGEDTESLAWAQRRGFVVDRERTESVLDLKEWDGARFAGHLEKVEAGGIRLLGIHGTPSDDLLRGMYEVTGATIADIPGFDWKMKPFEAWSKDLVEAPAPFFCALALDGDKVAGYSLLYLPEHPGGGADTDYTGVLREYRGRGIALAVKLLTVQAALEAEASYMRTNNDPDNPSMLAVNAKMGYKMVPGPRRLHKPTEA